MPCPDKTLAAWFNRMPSIINPAAPAPVRRDATPHGKLIVTLAVGQTGRFRLVERGFDAGVLTLDLVADPAADPGQARFEGFLPLKGVQEVKVACGEGQGLSTTEIETVY